MMFIRAVAFACLITAPAYAQQQQQLNPDVQACHSKLFESLQSELSVRAQAFALAAENAKLKEEIAALKSASKKD